MGIFDNPVHARQIRNARAPVSTAPMNQPVAPTGVMPMAPTPMPQEPVAPMVKQGIEALRGNVPVNLPQPGSFAPPIPGGQAWAGNWTGNAAPAFPGGVGVPGRFAPMAPPAEAPAPNGVMPMRGQNFQGGGAAAPTDPRMMARKIMGRPF